MVDESLGFFPQLFCPDVLVIVNVWIILKLQAGGNYQEHSSQSLDKSKAMGLLAN